LTGRIGLKIAGNRLTTTLNFEGNTRLTGGTSVSNDQMVELTMFGTPNGDLVLKLRDDNNGNAYFANIYADRVLIQKVQGYGGTVIGSVIYSTFTSGNRLQFKIVGSTLSLSRDGTQVASVTDSSWTTGLPGFNLDSPNVYIDDLIIGTYSGAVAPPPPAAVPGRYVYRFNVADGTAMSTVLPELTVRTGLRVAGNRLITTLNYEGNTRLSGGANISNDQSVEFTLFGMPNGGIVLKLRDDNNGNAYFAYIYADQVIFQKVQNYGGTAIGRALYGSFASGNRLQFRVVGTALTFTRDGVTLASFSDPTWATGRPGFNLDSTNLSIDDLVIGTYSATPAF
jgi:hypothetical protein